MVLAKPGVKASRPLKNLALFSERLIVIMQPTPGIMHPTAMDIFSGDTYTTPANQRTDWQDFALLRSRWWLYSRFVGTVFKSRRLIEENRYGNDNWAETSLDVMRAIEAVGGRFEISGIDNLRKAEGPLVIIANHMSALETFVLPCIVTPIKPTTFVVKEKLMRGVFFGKIMKSRNPIVVGRENAREDMEIVLREGEKRLKDGLSVILFPEGTRQKSFIAENFNSLGTKLAKRAGVKVLPVALKTDFWSNGRILKGFGPLKRRRRIHIAFGEAMDVEKKEKETHQKIVDFIASHYADWSKPA